MLAGPRVADPRSGFPDGPAKLAYLEGAIGYLEGAIGAPAVLPSGPAAAASYPLISAREAFTVFKSAAAKGPPAGVRLTISTVRLGTGVFPTDRGPRRLPAWLFGFRGVQDPAAVLAVAPASIFTPPGRPAGRPPFVRDARLGTDRRTLTVEFTGAPSGTGPCTAGYTLELAESVTAVAVAVREHAYGGSVACSAVGYPRHVSTVLSAPLGARVGVDAASGTAVAVTEAVPSG